MAPPVPTNVPYSARLDVPQTVTELPQSKAFDAMSPLRQAQVRALMETDCRLGMRARLAVSQVLTEPGFESLSPEGQAARIGDVLSKPPAVPSFATGEVRRASSAAPWSVGAPTTVADFQFNGRKADALVYPVTVGSRTVPITVPADGRHEGSQHSVGDVAGALAELPPQVLAEVTGVHLAPGPNPADAYWAGVYGTPGFTSYMTCGGDGIVSIYPQSFASDGRHLASTLTHETGHAWSQREWGVDPTAASWDPWRKAAEADGLKPSVYAANSLDEDVAETTTLYFDSMGTPEHELFRALYPSRFALLDARFGRQP